jgi:beta-galactosidase
MRSIMIGLAVALALALPAHAEQRSLSQDWRFHAGDAPGAETPAFDATSWRTVTVPHDWSIMDKPDGSPPFVAAAPDGQDYAYLPGGVGWYRRTFTLSEAEAMRVIRLNFEAVYMDAEIWLNGEKLGGHAYGYTAFGLDLTGKVRAGENLVAVRVNSADPSSRWYSGSGIIRPVTLELLHRVAIDPDSVFVTTPVATAERAEVEARAIVRNRKGSAERFEVVSRVLDADGKAVATTSLVAAAPAGGDAAITARLPIKRPALWSTTSPHLYTLVQEVRMDGAVIDERRTRFGVRTVTMDARNGLLLNGEPVELRGGNIHHDNYMLGAAGAPDADRRKVELMKTAGYNAIRSAHNPASQATLDAADELGMLVIDEAFDTWRSAKRAKDYSRFFADNWQADIDSLVLSGRNHPSVIMWSIGNEIPEQGSPGGVATATALAQRVRFLDPTRPVTQAVNVDSPANARAFAPLDVAGYNYRAHFWEGDHQTHPDRVMYGAESLSKAAFDDWRRVETMPWVIGDFVWTAVDYLGESGIGWMGFDKDWKGLGPYPWHLAYSGEIDATGRKRAAAYYRQVIWKTGIDPVAAFVRAPEGARDLPDRDLFKGNEAALDWSLEDLHPSWTWPGQEGKPLEVVVYSEFPEIELFLNGQSLGRKAVGVETEYKVEYQVPYAAGRLVAVGYRGGREAGRWELRTAGPPAMAKVGMDRRVRANGEDLAYLAVELVDSKGVPIYARADERAVKLTVKGPAILAGVGNGDPTDASSFQTGVRKTFHGRLVAAIRSTPVVGPVTVEVAVEGLPTVTLTLRTVAP